MQMTIATYHDEVLNWWFLLDPVLHPEEDIEQGPFLAMVNFDAPLQTAKASNRKKLESNLTTF
jgi:hypothetical protein